MKNLRISKKNPSKILKILQIPQSYRYSNSNNLTNLDTASNIPVQIHKSRDEKINKPSSYRQKFSNYSPIHSQRVQEFQTMDRSSKIKSKSLNKSQQELYDRHINSFENIPKESSESKSKRQYRPYLKLIKKSQKGFNNNSSFINDRIKRQSKELKKDHSSSKKHTNNLRLSSLNEKQKDKKQYSEILQNAKDLMKKGQNRKSILLVKSILRTKPQHIEALFVSGLNWYALGQIQKTQQNMQKIIQIKNTYNAQCYKIVSVCLYKKGKYEQSLEMLQLCHQLFPSDAESYSLQGKIYLKIQHYDEALKKYQKAYEIDEKQEYLYGIANIYDKMERYDQAYNYYSKIESKDISSTKILFNKLQFYQKIQKFEQIVKIIEQLQKSVTLLNFCKTRAQIYYIYAYSCYRLNKLSSSAMICEQGLKLSQDTIKYYKLLIMIKIKQSDFYEASYLIERIPKKSELNDQQFTLIVTFVDGVMNLMRRNYSEAINILLSIQHQLSFHLLNQSRLGSVSRIDDISLKNSNSPQSYYTNKIRNVYLHFLSYGYYCLDQFHSCRRIINLQKELNFDDEEFVKGQDYNLKMANGIIHHCQKEYNQAEEYFLGAKLLNQKKLQPVFCLAINYVQQMLNSKDKKIQQEYKQKSQLHFSLSKKIVGKLVNNIAANVYYYCSLFYGYFDDWKQALISIDESIDRSQDHYWRYFYLRAMLLACIHSFRQAINDVSIAINLSNGSKPECFLLRSKCLQIESQGNEAFKDLQQYISLKPDDPQVHKYAGQLLFENGAFEDSIIAFGHQDILLQMQNYDVLLTQSKSYFLLGKFEQAILIQKKAYFLKPQVEELLFDISVIECLNNLCNKIRPYEQLAIKLDQIYKNNQKVGKIFKKTDYYVLRAVIFLYSKQHEKAILSFYESIRQKSVDLNKSQLDEIIDKQNQKQLETFTNQMLYNISVCYLMLNLFQKSLQVCEEIKIGFQQNFYGDFINYKRLIRRDLFQLKKDQVFPNRNKLSNYLQKVEILISSDKGNKVIPLKLCIPFPKVEPPQIFPTFDKQLLRKMTVLNVQRKPEAPWVIRENNSIKFTDKIQSYSKFELQDSDIESNSTYQLLSVDNSHIKNSSILRSRKLKKSGIEMQRQNIGSKIMFDIQQHD